MIYIIVGLGFTYKHIQGTPTYIQLLF